MCNRHRWLSVISIALLALAFTWKANAQTAEDILVVTGAERLADSALGAAIAKYYQAETERDWSTTYGIRPQAYQKIVPFETYKRDMDKGMADWKLKKIEILESGQQQNGDTTVKIRFHDAFGPKAAQFYFEGRVSQGVNTRTENTLWRKVDDSWRCVDAGGRGHLPLNGRMVYD